MKKLRLALAATCGILSVVGAIAVHLYLTYIAYHDGIGTALVTFVSPPLSEIFWFFVIWHATGTPFTLYGSGFIAVLSLYGLALWVGPSPD